MHAHRSRSVVGIAAVVVVAAACGGPTDTAGSPATTAVEPPPPETAAPTSPPTSTAATATTAPPAPGTTAPAVSTTTAPGAAQASPTTTTTLPGEPSDTAFTPAGAVLDVIGIAFDDVLTVHALPGDDQPVVARLAPLSGDVVSAGRARRIDNGTVSVWLEVSAGGAAGWVRCCTNLAYLGGAKDVTAVVTAAVGRTPTAPSMLELGRIVTDALVPSDPAAPPAEIVIAAAPGDGPTAVVVYDTFPGEFFGSDTDIGSRYTVTGRRVASAALPATGFAPTVRYELVRVETMAFCIRGTTDGGLCV